MYRPNIIKLQKTLFHLKEALYASDKARPFERSTLFIVDNSVPSIEKSILEGIIREYYFGMDHPRHGVILKALGKNIGYGAAHNYAIRGHGYIYHLILNPDVYLYPDALIAFREYSEQHEDTVLITPMIFSPDGAIQYLLRRDPSLLDVSLRFIGIFLRSLTELKRYRLYECRDVDMNRVQHYYIMSGCCMWCKTEALQATGGFDERFFLYCEDYDLSKRLRQVGRTVYLPHARAIHDWDRAITKSLRLMLINIRSTIAFFNKWGWRIF